MDWQTLRTQYRVGDFVAWKKDDAVDLNPNFQRRPVWKKGAKSFLIDTIIRGLPIPIIFLRDMRSDLRSYKARRDVVDGQQRIRTVLSFIDPELLDDFVPERDEFTISKVHNSDYGGKRFRELPPNIRQKILDYQFSVHSFPADTDDRQILQIFARMNSTGVKLNAQELRNAEWFGLFKTTAYQIATEQLNRWRDWGVFSPDQIARMNEVELTSEFMILIMSGILEKQNRTIDDFYEKYDAAFRTGPEVSRRYRATFGAIEGLIGAETVSALFRTRTLFFALFATIYGLQFGLMRPSTARNAPGRPLTSKKRAKAIPSAITARMIRNAQKVKDRDIPESILKAVRGATTDAAQRRTLIDYLAGNDSPCHHLS